MSKDEIPNPDEIVSNQQSSREYIQKTNRETKQAEEQQKAIPQAQEPKQPNPAQITVKEADETAKLQRIASPSFPTSVSRPSAPKNVKEEGNVIVAKALAEQLGTSPEIKGQQRIDERKMAVLSDTTLASLSHFSYRYIFDGVRYWGHITEWWLIGSQGIGGLGRRHILQALANTSGIQSVDKAKTPNAVARNVWDRNWKNKAEQKGEVVEE